MKKGKNKPITFEEFLNRSNGFAHSIQWFHNGGYEPEDIVSETLLEKYVEKGKSKDEIIAMDRSPTLRRQLINSKINLHRREKAKKRWGGQSVTALEEIEPFHGSNYMNPEAELLKKEELSLLKETINKANLSDTQLQILSFDQEGYTSKEIASMLGIDKKSVYSRRSEAIIKIKKIRDKARKRGFDDIY